MKPILFNTEMVRAILDGRKTVTRRVVKPQPDRVYSGGNVELRCHADGPHKDEWHCYRESPPLDKVVNSPWGGQISPPFQAGDTLYVRETWAYVSDWINVDPDVGIFDGYIYKADWKEKEHPKWRPSINMPKEAARIFLQVTDVYPQRLQNMTEDDVCDEGAEKIISWCEHIDYSVVPPEPCYNTLQCKDCIIFYSYPELFGKMVWNPTIKKKDMPLYGWGANPWVWVIKFERCEIDVK